MRGAYLLVAAVSYGLTTLPLAGAEELPLPDDVKALGPGYEIAIGSQPLLARNFATSHSVGEVRAFYHKELAKHGWQVGALPWIEGVRKKQQEFKQALQQHPDWEHDPALTPEMKTQLRDASTNIDRLTEQMAGTLYATRGTDHVWLTMSPDAEGTVVAVAQWEGGSSHPFLERTAELDQPSETSPLGGNTWPS
ncbi:MAG: hypothetical protein HYZ91_07010, partial [Candidatus Omnitrophica bacterium]|nr:hypothetical protein [Candidatus Omnitrophota bacterium]